MAPRLVADSMLGRLARWLRALGFDAAYHPFVDDHQVIAWARARGAVVLTRDTRMLRPADVRVLLVEHDTLERQLAQVVAEAPLDLAQARPLTRCTVCNEMLVGATRDEVWNRIPPYVYLTRETFARCPGCGRVYWEGTHVPRLRARLARLAAEAGQGKP